MHRQSKKSSRPLYETAEDRRNQDLAIGHLARATRTNPVPTEPLVAWDYEMHREGQVVALVEVKWRRCAIADWPHYMISERKARKLYDASVERHVATGLLVRFSDGLGWMRVDTIEPTTWNVRWGGRRDRNDPLDMEQIVYFPMSGFRFICTDTGRFLPREAHEEEDQEQG